MLRLFGRYSSLTLVLAAIVAVSCATTSAAATPDTEPPSTYAEGWQGVLWHTTPVTVTFIASDGPDGAGVAYTEYIVDPPVTPAMTDSGTRGTSVTISADGKHRVWYRSVDLAGPANLESWEWVPVWIDSTLVPGSITGTVRDEQGCGIPGVEVLLLGPGAPQDSGWTDASGVYAFAGLLPGTYKVRFYGAMAGDYLTCYYHGCVERAGFGGYDTVSLANPVTVVEGLTTSGIDEVLPPAGHVTGTVKDGSEAGLSRVEIRAWVKLDRLLVGAMVDDERGGWYL